MISVRERVFSMGTKLWKCVKTTQLIYTWCYADVFDIRVKSISKILMYILFVNTFSLFFISHTLLGLNFVMHAYWWTIAAVHHLIHLEVWKSKMYKTDLKIFHSNIYVGLMLFC